MMTNDWTEFDIYFEEEEAKSEEEKQKELDALYETPPEDITLDKEKLMNITKRALAKEESKKSFVSPEQQEEVNAHARQVAYNILEWVYLSAEAGEWSYRHDMTKLPRAYLMPTVQEVKRNLLNTFVRYSDSESNRWIEVSWIKSNEV